MTENVVNLSEHKQAQSPTNEPSVPDFITMSDIDKMTDDELDAMLAAIRTRRMTSYHIYKRTADEKEHITEAKAKARVEKKCEQIIKKLNTLDKGFDDLERFIAELRGLRLQAGLEIM